jgi:hypothetical protein
VVNGNPEKGRNPRKVIDVGVSVLLGRGGR